MRTSGGHWREYGIEAICLAIFMVSAASFATLLQHPASPLHDRVAAASPLSQRMAMGGAMGLTLAAIVYSPLGRRSGAHMNPAMTLTFLRLGKVARADAAGYIGAQFAGGAGGILIADAILRGRPSHPAINFVATVPGMSGLVAAFAAEAAISFGMMLLVLGVSNAPRVSRFTGAAAALLVATYITFETPLSGMSMNPARTLGPAMLAHTSSTLWIYFTAPPLGMLFAAELFVRARGRHAVRCAKLHHARGVRCIFRCGYAAEEERPLA